MSTALHRCPDLAPVAFLDCAEPFSTLTSKEKLYAHFLSKAAWAGFPAAVKQVNDTAYRLFSAFLRVFRDGFQAGATAAAATGIPEEEFNAFVQFVAYCFGNGGNYLNFGDTKFIPNCAESSIAQILEQVGGLPSAEAHLLAKSALSLAHGEREFGFGQEGVSGYYSAGMTEEEATAVDAKLRDWGLMLENTRVFKTGNGKYEVRIASSERKIGRSEEFSLGTMTEVYGDFSTEMKKMVTLLSKAREYASNPTQRKVLDLYIDHFTSGDGHKHVDSQRHWVQDKGPSVEANIGFIETYRDPAGVRAEYEGLVAVVDKVKSAKFQQLVADAESLLAKLPWPKEFEKDVFQKPDFTSLEVVTFASSGVPAGINLPNYAEVRQASDGGFKNVSLSNVIMSSYKVDKVSFVCEADQEVFKRLRVPSFEVQVGLHELLGHGSGKLFSEDENGKKNFDPDMKHPLFEGEKISTFYSHGMTYDNVFGYMGSAMEECRAECVGLVLCVEPEVGRVFGYAGAAFEDIYYVNWLSLLRSGVTALYTYSPETNKWRQAHSQARFVILQALLRAGQGLIELRKNDGETSIILDRTKIMTVGVPAVAKLLQAIQIFRATADVRRASEIFNELSAVDETMLVLRQEVIDRYEPRKVLIQANTVLEGDKTVKLKTYESSATGMIESFVDRFVRDKDLEGLF